MELKKTYKRSRQRNYILQVLKNTSIHPTANWIYDQLKPEFPGLSLGTVYRNLNILLEQGKIQKLQYGSTFDRYDGNLEPHHHFICKKCGSVYDIKMNLDSNYLSKVEHSSGHQIHSHRLEFYGICSTCQE